MLRLLLIVTITGAVFQAAGAEPLIAPHARVTRLATGFQYTEGPTADAHGNVYFSDVPRSQTHRWSVDGQHQTLRTETGGGNGMGFDSDGTLYICEGGNRRIAALQPDGRYTVIAERYQGKRFNKPNDLWVTPDGGVYFSDPQSPPQAGVTTDYDMETAHIYHIAPGTHAVTRVTQNVKRPNGLVGTADGKTLYATDRETERVYAWDIQPDGSLENRRIFCKRSTDGMALDNQGNLYVATETIEVFNPQGELVLTIEVPEKPSNVCFGGKDRRTLFITARKSLYAVSMSVSGQ